MRRKDREVTEISEIQAILNSCKVIRLAMIDGNRPYVVPLNFGYTCENNEFTFYCHSANEGRKIALLHNNPNVFFEMDCGHELVSHQSACGHSYHYACVMGDGVVEFLDGTAKTRALSAIMEHQTGKHFDISAAQAEAVSVFSIRAISLSAKKNPS